MAVWGGLTNSWEKKGSEKFSHTVKYFLFNLHAKYIMRNSGLDEAQAGIKTAGKNINNLKYADDTTFMAESE